MNRPIVGLNCLNGKIKGFSMDDELRKEIHQLLCDIERYTSKAKKSLQTDKPIGFVLSDLCKKVMIVSAQWDTSLQIEKIQRGLDE